MQCLYYYIHLTYLYCPTINDFHKNYNKKSVLGSGFDVAKVNYYTLIVDKSRCNV